MGKTAVKYQAYPKYKDSGVEWLGEIPSGWEAVPAKHIFNIFNGSTPQSSVEEYWDGDIIWVTPSDLSKIDGAVICNSERYITKRGFDSCGTNLIPKNSIVVSCRAPIGSLAITENELCTNQGCKSLVPKQEFSSKFYYYFLSVSVDKLNVLGRGSTFLELSTTDLGDFSLPRASQNELDGIVGFLDHETAKIDQLIAKQQQLIELLKEKRQAVVSHAVTKGLDPNVPMKDSGVAWLGEVPAHWEFAALKHVLEIPMTDGPHETPEFIDDGVPFVSAEAVSSGIIDFNKIRGYISAEEDIRFSKKYKPKLHDVYMIKSGATTGLTAIVETEQPFNIWSPLAAMRCNENYEPYFLLNYLRSELFQKLVQLSWTYGTQQNIGMATLENLLVCVPPNAEQIKIANFLCQHTAKIDNLISKVESAINLMQERRTALISAAVTGKIDVRHWQAPVAAEITE